MPTFGNSACSEESRMHVLPGKTHLYLLKINQGTFPGVSALNAHSVHRYGQVNNTCRITDNEIMNILQNYIALCGHRYGKSNDTRQYYSNAESFHSIIKSKKTIKRS